MADLSRRALLGLAGAGALGFAASWPRLTAQDIPGRGSDALTVAILGTAQDAAARSGLVRAFNEQHPDIPVRIVAVQGQDWSNFFAKILTMVAAGTPPDVCVVATEGAQLFAERLAQPLDDYVRRDAAELQDFFDDVHPSLVEAFMYQGSLFQLP
jgi:multiple sugar transport system substrate-binding protein